MYTVALIGAGRIGQIHARNIAYHPQSKLRYVADIFAESAEKLAATYGAEVSSVEHILADDSVDVIVVASSTDTHASLSEQAMLAGKAVFCEKPIDLDIERVRQCVQIAKEKNAQMMVGFNRRFDPNFSHLKKCLDNGEVGDLEQLHICSRDPGALPIEYLKESGGMFRDMTIHDFDMARWILGEEPVSVHATAAALTDPEIAKLGDIDTAIVSLQCANGKMAVITNSRRAAYGYDQRIEVLGSKGMLNVANVVESTLVKSTVDCVASQKPKHFFLERYTESYLIEWDHFVGTLDNKNDLWPTAQDGERALVLAEAAVESLASGKTVSLNWN